MGMGNMRTTTKFWRFKAYDAQGDSTEGVLEGPEPLALVVQLRQEGLQVYDMVSISPAEYNREKVLDSRLARLRRLNARAAQRPQKTSPQNATPKSKTVDGVPEATFWVLRRRMAMRQRWATARWTALAVAAVVAVIAAVLWLVQY